VIEIRVVRTINIKSSIVVTEHAWKNANEFSLIPKWLVGLSFPGYSTTRWRFPKMGGTPSSPFELDVPRNQPASYGNPHGYGNPAPCAQPPSARLQADGPPPCAAFAPPDSEVSEASNQGGQMTRALVG